MHRATHRRRVLRFILGLLLVLASGVRPVPAFAEEPEAADYSLPARFALPWACGESFRVTWEPQGHWENGKATGVAYDFGLPEGTPVFAPASGTAYFLRDDRPLETNFGHYIDLVVEGGWLIRLAHLAEEQSGEREVRAGELIGYSGVSGVTEAHLRVEILAREGRRWVRPEADLLDVLFGVPVADLVEETQVVNAGCAVSLAMDGEARLEVPDGPTPIGQPTSLWLPLYNEGLEDAAVERAAVSLRGPDGTLSTVTAEGAWDVPGKGHAEITVPVRPDEAGPWAVEGVVLSVQGAAHHLPAAGGYLVDPAPVALVGLRTPPVLQVGEQVRVEVWLQNETDADAALDGLYVSGLTASHETWEAVADRRIVVPAGEYRRLILETASVPHSVGQWTATRVDALASGERLVLARVEEGLSVEGAELAIERLEALPDDAATISLVVTNRGTVPTAPDDLLLWGEDADGWRDISLPGDLIGPLAPGESREVLLAADDYPLRPDFRLVDAGFWAAGEYLPLRLPPRLGYDAQASEPSEEAADSGTV